MRPKDTGDREPTRDEEADLDRFEIESCNRVIDELLEIFRTEEEGGDV